MEIRTVTSTSTRSALTNDLVLRVGSEVRLIFRPLLVENEQDPEASLKGTFLYQRKARAGNWEDFEITSLRSIKSGEEYHLELKSTEVLKLFRELADLYSLRRTSGIPRGEAKYVKATGTFAALSNLTDEEVQAVVAGSESLGVTAIARLIKWASSSENFDLLFARLESAGANSLRNLNAALGMTLMKKALVTWRQNRANGSEEFWQSLLASQSFVLEQVFSLPIVVIEDKAYVGGKTITNSGGHVADFLVKNSVTDAVGLIEIKTPKAPLLGAQYRSGIYNISSELSGAVQQVLAYRASLAEERHQLLRHYPNLGPISPRCLVIIGHAGVELCDSGKRQAFEMYRAQLKDVEVITYDEVFFRTQRLVAVLEGGMARDSDPTL
jgi:hypothetical protein